MKILIASDIHISENKRLEDTKDGLKFIKTVAYNEQPTYMLLLGDIFDKRKPTPRELRVFNQWLLSVRSDVVSQIYILEGNHDQDRNISTLSYLDDLGVSKVRVIKPPYVFGKFYLGHEHVDGAVADNGISLSGGRKLADIIAQNPNCEVFAFGDFHKPQILSEKPLAFYAGSLVKTSFGERDHKKRLWLFEETKLVKTIEIPGRAMKQYDIEVKDGVDKNAPWDKDELDGALVKVVYKGTREALSGVDTTSVKEYLKKVKNVKELKMSFDIVDASKPRNEKINEEVPEKELVREYFSSCYKGNNRELALKYAESILEKSHD